MLFASLASLLALAFAGVAVSQDPTAGQPACFLQCAQTASAALGCTGATDFPCYCTKQQFMVDNARCTLQACPELATNNSVITTSFAQLEAVCRAATGSFNLTIPSEAELGVGGASASSAAPVASSTGAVAPTGSSSSSVSRSTSHASTRTSTVPAASNTSTANQNGASSSSVMPAMVGLSVLSVGFALLA